MNKWKVRPSTGKEMAALYGVSYNVFKKWISFFEGQIGPKLGNFYTVKQVLVIFEVLGTPASIEVD